ncbi:unnamed protein product [Acanthoscelides obtectus]|uniref:Uncharacterized protein n=1 Tax=Acanthoscelides obtectus TaxID=200917 RepID=A0A9P0MEL8_ACAOB|nr:unnamed protein product [Acanthoscelides obtectus]CAK1627103.1 hypothetical protein AOBTE_LOCUS4305 [Acanthoscelides obtectus]
MTGIKQGKPEAIHKWPMMTLREIMKTTPIAYTTTAVTKVQKTRLLIWTVLMKKFIRIDTRHQLQKLRRKYLYLQKNLPQNEKPAKIRV